MKKPILSLRRGYDRICVFLCALLTLLAILLFFGEDNSVAVSAGESFEPNSLYGMVAELV